MYIAKLSARHIIKVQIDLHNTFKILTAFGFRNNKVLLSDPRPGIALFRILLWGFIQVRRKIQMFPLLISQTHVMFYGRYDSCSRGVLPSGESLLDNNDLGSSPENAFLKVSVCGEKS
jgi:hypothetical protein